MEQEFPLVLTPLPEESQTRVKKRFVGFSEGLVDVGGRHMMPTRFGDFATKYFNFRFREDDVLVMTFPRSGTTWTQEIVWTMRNNVDLDTATKVPLDDRVPFIELDSLQSASNGDLSKHHTKGLFLDKVDALPSSRTIKTHFPFSLFSPDLLDKCKVVYVARNPRDVCVSFYHQQRLVKIAEFLGDFPEFVNFWCKDQHLRAPYWSHLSEAWERRAHSNMLFLFYEDMKENIMRELGRLNTFLETDLTDAQLETVARHTSFDGMKRRDTTNPMAALEEAGVFKKGEADFVRKGITGDWVNYFTPQLEDKFQAWMAKWQPISNEIPFRY